MYPTKVHIFLKKVRKNKTQVMNDKRLKYECMQVLSFKISIQHKKIILIYMYDIHSFITPIIRHRKPSTSWYISDVFISNKHTVVY